MMNSEDSAYVLYVDHQGHPAPLSLSYHATASRRLASSVDRHPPSSVTEVDSAYCPQCLSFHDANTAGNLGYCPKVECRLCPVCRSVATVGVDGSVFYYDCGLCGWNSKASQLQVSISDSMGEGGEVSLDTVEAASEELRTVWKAKIAERNKLGADHFSNMTKNLVALAKDHVKGQRLSTRRSGLASKRSQGGDQKGWSIEALEKSQRSRNEMAEVSVNKPVGGTSLKQISLDDGEENQSLYHPSLYGLSAETLLSQEVGGNLSGSMETLLPLSIPLRPRKSRRCRAELAESRPGILVKPKLNPLEGDSSLRTGHGQWWKKVRHCTSIQLFFKQDTLLPFTMRFENLTKSPSFFTLIRIRALLKFFRGSVFLLTLQMDLGMLSSLRYLILHWEKFV